MFESIRHWRIVALSAKVHEDGDITAHCEELRVACCLDAIVAVMGRWHNSHPYRQKLVPKKLSQATFALAPHRTISVPSGTTAVNIGRDVGRYFYEAVNAGPREYDLIVVCPCMVTPADALFLLRTLPAWSVREHALETSQVGRRRFAFVLCHIDAVHKVHLLAAVIGDNHAMNNLNQFQV